MEAWCVATHLAHLLRIEQVYVERLHVALAEDEPVVQSTRALNDDDPALAQHLAVPQIVHGLLNVRRDLLSALEPLTDQQLQRAVRHETLGRMTIADIAAKMANHEREHTQEVAVLVKGMPASARVVVPLVQTARPQDVP